MFLRKKKNKSGIFTVQIIEKMGRNNKILKVIGTTSVEKELEDLVFEAKKYIELQSLKLNRNYFHKHRKSLRKKLYLKTTQVIINNLVKLNS